MTEIEFTGIDEILSEDDDESAKNKTVYDLQGRVVENPTNGIYIVNGKKVVVR